VGSCEHANEPPDSLKYSLISSVAEQLLTQKELGCMKLVRSCPV
jgi:hypothetical protein